jgi:hypothetical protein
VIEQDCLVHRLDKALLWAQGKRMVYGFGQNCSFRVGWSENSFMYISNEYLIEMLHRLNTSGIHKQFDTPKRVSEIEWHELFRDDATFWDFGCGRLRPIPFESNEPFYSQQLQKWEIKKFMEIH